jgi:hypothetical protein
VAGRCGRGGSASSTALNCSARGSSQAAGRPASQPGGWAGRGRTCATRARLSELITLDLPTLGRPMMPTVIEVLSPALRE